MKSDISTRDVHERAGLVDGQVVIQPGSVYIGPLETGELLDAL